MVDMTNDAAGIPDSIDAADQIVFVSISFLHANKYSSSVSPRTDQMLRVLLAAKRLLLEAMLDWLGNVE